MARWKRVAKSQQSTTIPIAAAVFHKLLPRLTGAMTTGRDITSAASKASDATPRPRLPRPAEIGGRDEAASISRGDWWGTGDRGWPVRIGSDFCKLASNLCLGSKRSSRVLDDTTEPRCEDTLPTTGRRCHRPALIVVIRFGEPFNLCAECALRDHDRVRRKSKRGLKWCHDQEPFPSGI